jgi:hypothetical protein
VGLGFSTLLLTPALWIITRPALREDAPEPVQQATEGS